MTEPGGIQDALDPDEHIVVDVDVDGFHASDHIVPAASRRVIISNRRFVVVGKRGMFKARYHVEANWPLAEFTERINSNEGTALGPFMYFLTLFTERGETVSSAFSSEQRRDEFKFAAAEAIATANGWAEP